MPDYYTPQQLARKLDIAESTIAELQTKGFLEPTIKDGRFYFSSRQAYRLHAAVRWACKDKIDLQEAVARVEKRWLAQTSAPKD